MFGIEYKPICLYGRIGEGAGSFVHSSIYSNHKCVVKFLDTSSKLINGNYKSLKRDLYSESNLLKEIHHPNVISLYQNCIKGALIDPFGIPFTAHYAIYELLEGGELLAYAKAKVLNEDELKYYGLQIVDGLQCVHEQGLAHRDLKSDNILLDSTLETAKLIDFGYSSRADQVLHSCAMKGTKEYMAPEIHSLIPYDAQKADVFALGVTLHTLATGAFPCHLSCAQSDSLYKILCEKKYSEFWKKTSTQSSSLSPSFKELIQEMLHPSFYRRPTISQIKETVWFKIPGASKEAVIKSMAERREKFVSI